MFSSDLKPNTDFQLGNRCLREFIINNNMRPDTANILPKLFRYKDCVASTSAACTPKISNLPIAIINIFFFQSCESYISPATWRPIIFTKLLLYLKKKTFYFSDKTMI